MVLKTSFAIFKEARDCCSLVEMKEKIDFKQANAASNGIRCRL